MIQIHHLSLKKVLAKQTQWLLKEVNTTFEPNKMHIILGPNGAGKSSLLKCLSKDETDYEGQIIFEQQDLKTYSFEALAQQRAVLNQSNRIDFALTVRQVVALGQAIQPASQRVNLETLLAQFELIALQARSYATLSGGEKQRVQLARVIAQLGQAPFDGQWLFLDEWTTGLDLKHIQTMSEYFKQLISQGLSLIMVLHDLNLANQIADKVLLMKQGELLYQGSKEIVLTVENLEAIYEVSMPLFNAIVKQNKGVKVF